MDEPTLDNISGDSVEVSRAAVRNISANVAGVQMSAVQSLTAAQASLQQSAAAFVRAQQVSVQSGVVGVAVGREVAVENASAFLLLAPSVTGNVKAVITLRTALALGFGFYLGRKITRIMGRLLKR